MTTELAEAGVGWGGGLWCSLFVLVLLCCLCVCGDCTSHDWGKYPETLEDVCHPSLAQSWCLCLKQLVCMCW